MSLLLGPEVFRHFCLAVIDLVVTCISDVVASSNWGSAFGTICHVSDLDWLSFQLLYAPAK